VINDITMYLYIGMFSEADTFITIIIFIIASLLSYSIQLSDVWLLYKVATTVYWTALSS